MLCVLGPAWTLLLWKYLLGVWPSGKPRCLGRGEWRALFRVEMGFLALPKMRQVWSGGGNAGSGSGGVGGHLCPLQGGPLIISPLCGLADPRPGGREAACPWVLWVEETPNSCRSQETRVSAWNLPKGLVSMGSLVFHFVYSQNPALSFPW